MQISTLISANIQSLKQAEELLLSIQDHHYRAVVSPYTANLGKHMRHIIDHYQILLNSLESGSVDYDNRDRAELEELERSTMILRLRQICNQLQSLSDTSLKDRTLLVKLAVDEGMEAPRVPSSLSRELVFLQSHTVHHYAIIAGILKIQNLDVDADFGIAPSTLKYEQLKKCAP